MSEKRILKQVPEGQFFCSDIKFHIVNYEPHSTYRSPKITTIDLEHKTIEGLKALVEDILKAFDKPVIAWKRPEIKELID